jgi:hypothetical protein
MGRFDKLFGILAIPWGYGSTSKAGTLTATRYALLSSCARTCDQLLEREAEPFQARLGASRMTRGTNASLDCFSWCERYLPTRLAIARLRSSIRSKCRLWARPAKMTATLGITAIRSQIIQFFPDIQEVIASNAQNTQEFHQQVLSLTACR